MVVQARPSIRRRIERSSMTSITLTDWIGSLKLDPINIISANYIGPSIVLIISYVLYLLTLVPFIFWLKNVDMDFTLVIPFIVVLCNALLVIILYSLLFKNAFNNQFYYSLGIYQTTYIWILLTLASVFSSLLKNPRMTDLFAGVSSVIYAFIATFFLRSNLSMKVSGLETKTIFFFNLLIFVDALIVSGIILNFSIKTTLFIW